MYAYSEDGLLEAFELEGDRFLMGLQWHPEMLMENVLMNLRFLNALLKVQRNIRLIKKQEIRNNTGYP
ncbi:MAG TPA: gamma-glutamyl-gamma-aminobutyrate hydrolase family protein [Clostridia bacterium]|nr:gamma-glutamyl-gamma-aminobutyrate hydrolase family protein [Clostridia bacterium]